MITKVDTCDNSFCSPVSLLQSTRCSKSFQLPRGHFVAAVQSLPL